MKDFFLKKEAASRIFIIFIFAFSILNFRYAYSSLKEIMFEEIHQSSEISIANINSIIRNIEHGIDEHIFGKVNFIEAFGYLQLLMDKKEQSNFEIVKDEEGLLHFTYFADRPREVQNLVDRVNIFKESLTDENINFLYVLTPDKYIVGQTEFAIGLPYNFENETADEFLRLLNENEIDTVDLRENILKSGMSYSDIFFKTDHHWTIESSFWAFGELVNALNENYDMEIDAEGFYTDINNYNVVTYPKSYVGSLGRQTGKYYSGVDDFSIIFPKFSTDFEFSIGFNSLEENQFSGLFEDVFISSYILHRATDPYDVETDKYFSYLLGNQGIAHIKNTRNPDGLKLAIVKDSMIVPVISFLATVSSDIYFIDPRYFSDDIAEFINNLEYLDFVMLSFYPQNITEQFLPFQTSQ